MPINSTVTAGIEADVIRRAQEGDADAFATLFHTHKTRVYSLCLRMTKNAAEAEDLTQEAFLHVFRKLAAFRAESALSTWLYRVAANTVLMHFRKKCLRQVSLDRPSVSDQFDKPQPREFPSTDSRLVGSVDRVTLSRALAELPEGYRKIFLLHEVEGFAHGEIAEFLGCSVGNSKSQLHKARQRIRELLAGPGETHAEAPSHSRIKVELQTRSEHCNRLTRADLPLRAPITARMPTLAQTNA